MPEESQQSARDAAVASVQALFVRGSFDRGDYDPRWKACWRERRAANALLECIMVRAEAARYALNWHHFAPERSEADAEVPLRELYEAMGKLFGQTSNVHPTSNVE